MFNDHSTVEARAENEIPLQSLLLPLSLSLLPSAITMFLRIATVCCTSIPIYLETRQCTFEVEMCLLMQNTVSHFQKFDKNLNRIFEGWNIIVLRD